MDVQAVERESVRLLELLCRRPSISAEGRELEETADLVEELLAEAGFATRQLTVDSAPPAVYGELPGRSDTTLLLYNHYDVQPVDPLELWTTPPFEPVVRDGRLYARGSADNKAELALRLAAIRALTEADGAPPVGIRWIVEGEEEVGSPHFGEIVRANADLLRADGCLWEGSGLTLDGRPEIGLGFKGLLEVRLEVEALTRDAHSSLAAVLPSAAWRLVSALASLRGPDGRVRIPGFYDAVREPTEAELRVIAAQSDTVEQELEEAFGVREFVNGLTGSALRERAIFTPTCNIAGVHSGYAGPGTKTVLPARASASLDFRLVPHQRAEDILELLRAHLDREGFGDVAIASGVFAEAAATPLDDPFVARVVAVAERVSGMPASVWPLSPATLPIVAPIQRHVGVPGLSAPDNPVYGGSAAHAPDENVRLEDFAPAIRFFAALLEELAA
ncbi:MAG TPA: M20/M25/M40 family metallo-hydrolase [Gaiellaceae bacterium]